MSKIKLNSRSIASDRTRLVMAEDNNTRYGDDESSESDSEQNVQDGIPLVRRNIHK